MNRLMTIDHSINYYLLFYLIGFTIAYLVIFHRIMKMKEDRSLLLSITALIFLAFVLGCKLMPYMEYLLFPEQSHYLTRVNSQMAFGGMTLSLVVVLVIRKLINLPSEYWYSIGLAIVIGLFIQKPGCLLGGCCKGIETTNQFGIMYFDGIIRHPIQVYEWLLYLLIFILMIKLKTKRKDSKFYMVMSAYCFIQFGMEFLRVPEDTIAFAFTMFGLKAMQWNYLLLAFATLYFFIKNETRIRKVAISADLGKSFYHVFLLGLVIICFYLTHKQLYNSEVLAINLALLPALYYTFRLIFKSLTIPRYRWASLASLVIPMLLMGQTMKKSIEKEQKIYKTVRIGYHGGNFNNEVTNDTDPGSCGGNAYTSEFNQRYSTITLGFGVTKVRDDHILSYGVDASFGSLEETDKRINSKDNYTIGLVSPYVSYEGKWVGFGVGLHIGNAYYPWAKSTKQGTNYPESGLNKFPVLPRVNFRVGPEKVFFAEYNFADHFPTAIPAFTHEMALGSGFGSNNGFYLKSGFLFGSQSYENLGAYLKGYIPIDNKVVLEPLLGLGTMSNVYMLGVSYRFGFKEGFYKPQ